MLAKQKNIVLIPGFMLDDSLWDEFIHDLPSDWNIIKANLSQGETIEGIAQNIAQNAPEQFILIGFSLGGYIARSLVEQFPESALGLVLVASSSRPDRPEEINQKMTAIHLNTEETFRGLSSISIKKTLHPLNANNQTIIKRIQSMGKNLGYNEFVKQSRLNRETHDMNKILCPTLIISGKEDQIRTANEAIEMFKQIKNSTLEVIEDTGHMITIEQPKKLAAVILNWIKQKNIG